MLYIPTHLQDIPSASGVGYISQIIKVKEGKEWLQEVPELDNPQPLISDFCKRSTIPLQSEFQSLPGCELVQTHLHHQGTGVGDITELGILQVPIYYSSHHGICHLFIQNGRIREINIAKQIFICCLQSILTQLNHSRKCFLHNSRIIHYRSQRIQRIAVFLQGLKPVSEQDGITEIYIRTQQGIDIEMFTL